MVNLNSQLIQDVIAGIVLIGGIVVYSRGRVPQQTIKNQAILIDTYEKRLLALEEKTKEDAKMHTDNAKAIARLQGQVDLYKELPLRELADGIGKIVNTNAQILATLQSSATTLIKDTTETATHVREVKTDLEKGR